MAQDRVCSGCGSALAEDAWICGSCGTEEKPTSAWHRWGWPSVAALIGGTVGLLVGFFGTLALLSLAMIVQGKQPREMYEFGMLAFVAAPPGALIGAAIALVIVLERRRARMRQTDTS